MKPLILPTLLILAWVLHHNIKKNESGDDQSIDAFLQREDSANSTRKQDLSSLPYVQIPMESFPFDITLNDEKKQSQIEECRKKIEDLADKRMLNLIGISNTDLKEQYGPANLELLTTYDMNYTRYIQSISTLADCLYEEYPEQAVRLLEYVIGIGTDISASYTLLGRHYLEKGNTSSFDLLYSKVPDRTSIAGQVIKNKLDAMKEEYSHSA